MQSYILMLHFFFFLNYQSLNDSDRNVKYSLTYGRKCDDILGPGWFRFEGAAGTRMATSCTPYWRCNADATGWMTSGHPTVAEGAVTRTVCFRWDYCCYWSTTIKVRNCGSYYIYFLHGTDGVKNCSLRYCGTDWSKPGAYIKTEKKCFYTIFKKEKNVELRAR